MIIDESLLWSKLESFSPDNPYDVLSFAQRLARENKWPPFFAERVIAEYKKFIFLCMISPWPVTPSDEVDKAWRLHLVHTQSYWNDLCRNILQKDIHHSPTDGGSAQRDQLTSSYALTLQLYRDKFGHLPPDDIWPPATRRFNKAPKVTTHKATLQIITWHTSISSVALIIIGALMSFATGNRLFFIALSVSALALLIRQALLDVTMDISMTDSLGNSMDGAYGELTWYRRLRWIWKELGKWWDSIEWSED
jgi:hypothetical protein